MEHKIYCINCKKLINRIKTPKVRGKDKEVQLECPCGMIFSIFLSGEDPWLENITLSLPISSTFPYYDINKDLMPNFYCPLCKNLLRIDNFGESLRCSNKACQRIFNWNRSD